MTSPIRVRVPSILLLALAAALVFAATAAAETKVGEGTSPVNPSIENGEADLLSVTASFDTATGAVNFSLTPRVAPGSTPPTKAEVENEEEGPRVQYIAALIHSTIACNTAAYEAEESRAEKEREEGKVGTTPSIYPILAVLVQNRLETGSPYEAYWRTAMTEAEFSGAPVEGTYGSATKSVSGATLSTSATAPPAANGPYNCVLAEAVDFSNSESRPDILVFPLAPKAAAPAPAPVLPSPTAAFSLAKIKPLKAKEGKWTKVNVKVTNTGNAAAGPIAIKAKAPKGVVLQPASGSLKLPALLAGQSWTVTFKVKLTAKAKKSSTIKLTTSSGAISAAGSFAIKLLG